MLLFLFINQIFTEFQGEYKIYTFTGIVSSVGGSLGLFLGLSFWDFFQMLISKTFSYYTRQTLHENVT